MKWYEKAKRLMKQKGIKQKDLIGPLGVKTRGCVGHYLTGRRDLDACQLKVIADLLECSLDDLMGEEELDPVKLKINNIIQVTENTMATSLHKFTEAERLSIYRVAFATGLEVDVSDDQLMQNLISYVQIKNR
jgi:transcriptional regulator with XRE-family HTH domain